MLNEKSKITFEEGIVQLFLSIEERMNGKRSF